MHDTDSITKDYMKDAATFADAFNFLLYNVEPVIQPGRSNCSGTEESRCIEVFNCKS